jgi:signal transduction histidine kinase
MFSHSNFSGISGGAAMQQHSGPSDGAQDTWRVLVVDDEAAIAEEIVEYLTGRGISAISAAEASSALEGVRNDLSISVMMTDVRMPGVDGMTLAGQVLAARSDEHALEVVVLTGHASLDMAVDALRTRVFDFVRKPVRLRDVADSVRRANAAAQERRVRSRALAARATALAAEARALRAQVEGLPGIASAGRSADNGHVLAVINDEMRTPLVPILDLADLIERESGQLSEERLIEYGALIRQSGERLKEIAESFATLSALHLGTARPRMAHERAALILAALRARHEKQSAQRQQTLEVAAEGSDVVVTDRKLLVQALDQIVGNAIRFTPVGGTVRLIAQATADADVFLVEDTGPGMSDAEVQRARQPFRQGDASLARRHRGLGIGLVLAGGLAETLGGRLDIDSAPGRGTRASIILPRAGHPVTG